MEQAILRADQAFSGGDGQALGGRGAPCVKSTTLKERWSRPVLADGQGCITVQDRAASHHIKQANRLRFIVSRVKAAKSLDPIRAESAVKGAWQA
eukprot:5652644-Alexandrium_andersonii.AAC.1